MILPELNPACMTLAADINSVDATMLKRRRGSVRLGGRGGARSLSCGGKHWRMVRDHLPVFDKVDDRQNGQMDPLLV